MAVRVVGLCSDNLELLWKKEKKGTNKQTNKQAKTRKQCYILVACCVVHMLYINKEVAFEKENEKE